MILMPNGLLSFNMIVGNINSKQYIPHLAGNVPIIKLDYLEILYLQKDNASVHKSKKLKYFMMKSGISVLDWSARSPNLNIVKDC